MDSQITVEIIAIGNELLIGKIQDTNGLWIIHQLLPLGVKVNRVTIIPDDIEIIAQTIQEAINRKPTYIFTSGGLGPTFDDMTLEGVARGLIPPQKLEENLEAIDLIRRSYESRAKINPGKDWSMTPARRKMANLPIGSKPLSNREGSAPGVYISNKLPEIKSTIVCLPGVPSELKVIFQDHILPEIGRLTNIGRFYEAGFTFQDLGESRFTELVYQIKDQYPEIWIKTHPRVKEKLEVELHLTSFSQNPLIGKQMQELYHKLKTHVLQSGGIISQEKPLK